MSTSVSHSLHLPLCAASTSSQFTWVVRWTLALAERTIKTNDQNIHIKMYELSGNRFMKYVRSRSRCLCARSYAKVVRSTIASSSFVVSSFYYRSWATHTHAIHPHTHTPPFLAALIIIIVIWVVIVNAFLCVCVPACLCLSLCAQSPQSSTEEHNWIESGVCPEDKYEIETNKYWYIYYKFYWTDSYGVYELKRTEAGGCDTMRCNLLKSTRMESE